tara:strand:- start:168 stop:419 length:252 start_codon:yes stop_codon:yes gene_type:complete
MRTTVTIDPDTEVLIREEVRRSGRSFKVILNESVRRALRGSEGGTFEIEPLFNAPFPEEIGDANFNHLADEREDEATLRELSS